jgi:hypothetical protein
MTEAQRPAMPVIGWHNAMSPDDAVHLVVAAFRRGLGEGGFRRTGQNVIVEYRCPKGW